MRSVQAPIMVQTWAENIVVASNPYDNILGTYWRYIFFLNEKKEIQKEKERKEYKAAEVRV